MTNDSTQRSSTGIRTRSSLTIEPQPILPRSPTGSSSSQLVARQPRTRSHAATSPTSFSPPPSTRTRGSGGSSSSSSRHPPPRDIFEELGYRVPRPRYSPARPHSRPSRSRRSSNSTSQHTMLGQRVPSFSHANAGSASSSSHSMSFAAGPGSTMTSHSTFSTISMASQGSRATSTMSSSSFGCTSNSTNVQSSPLGMSLDVVLEGGMIGEKLEMYGGPRTGTSYSLPGHVVISLPALYPNPHDNRERELKSLEIVFEGKCEFYDIHGRFQVVRIHQIRKSLVPENGPPEVIPRANGSSPTFQYAIAFDLSIPGWLPPSFDGEMSTTSYGLVALSKIGWPTPSATVEECSISASASSWAPTPSSPIPIAQAYQSQHNKFTSRITRSLAAALNSTTSALGHPSAGPLVNNVRSEWKSIIVERHRVPPVCSSVPCFVNATAFQLPVAEGELAGTPNLRHFTLKPSEDSPSPVECIVSTPEFVDINGPSLRVSVRMRARKTPMPELSGALPEGAATAMGGVLAPLPTQDGDVDMDQFNFTPARRAHTDLGAETLDPPEEMSDEVEPKSKREMVDMAKVGTTRMVELGMEVEEIERYSSTPSQSYTAAYPLPAAQPDPFSDGQSHAPLLSPPSGWARSASRLSAPSSVNREQKVRVLLLGEDGQPRTYRFEGEGLELGDGWRKVNVIIPMPGHKDAELCARPMAEMENPFLRIKHKLKIRVVCRSSNMPGQDTIVVLTTPLRLATASQSRKMSLSYLSGQAPLSPLSSATPTPLPAYVQMFHENGMAKDDEDILPPYVSEEDPPEFQARDSSVERFTSAPSRDVPAEEDPSARGAMAMQRGSDLFEARLPSSSPALPSALLDVVGRGEAVAAPKVDEDEMDGVTSDGMNSAQPDNGGRVRPPSRADTSSPDPYQRGYFNDDLGQSSSTSTTSTPLRPYRFQAASMTDPACASTVGSPLLDQEEDALIAAQKRTRFPGPYGVTEASAGG